METRRHGCHHIYHYQHHCYHIWFCLISRMLEQMEGRWNVEVFSTWPKNSEIQKRLSKQVVSGQPTGPNITWLCDEGEFTHATIKGGKKTFLVRSHSHYLNRKNTDYAVQHMGGLPKWRSTPPKIEDNTSLHHWAVKNRRWATVYKRIWDGDHQVKGNEDKQVCVQPRRAIQSQRESQMESQIESQREP